MTALRDSDDHLARIKNRKSKIQNDENDRMLDRSTAETYPMIAENGAT